MNTLTSFNTRDLKQALRAGPYTFPGGYPLYFVMADGEPLSFESARENYKLLLAAIRGNCDSGWRPVAVTVNWEDPELYCSDTGKRIESAYAEPETSVPQENPEQEQQSGEAEATFPVCQCCGGDRDADTSDAMQSGDTLCASCDAESSFPVETPETVKMALLLVEPVTTEADARELFTALAAAGHTHNPDNDPSQSTVERDGVVSLMFTEAQAIHLRQRLKQCVAVCGSRDAVMTVACECYGIAKETEPQEEIPPIDSFRAGSAGMALKYHFTKTRCDYSRSPAYDLDRALKEDGKFIHLLRDLMHLADREGLPFHDMLAKAAELRRNGKSVYDA